MLWSDGEVNGAEAVNTITDWPAEECTADKVGERRGRGGSLGSIEAIS